MHRIKSSFRPAAVFIAAICVAAPPAFADTTTYDTPPPAAAPARPVAPSANNDAFSKLRERCETEVSCGKTSGDLCAEAAALLFGADLPDQFRDMNEAVRVKIALRLLERGVDSSNLARGRAYDWYSRSEIFNFGGYADSFRARELMEMMTKSEYPGATLRKARSTVSILSFTSTEADKREGCTVAKKLLSGGKLDADSARIAREVVDTGVCTGFEQSPAR